MMLLVGHYVPNIYCNKLQNILECFIDCAITSKKMLCAYYYSLIYSTVKYGIITRGNAAKAYLNRVTVRMNDALTTINFSSTYQNVNILYKNFELLKRQEMYRL